jgi:hypothetical protein
MLVVSTRGLCYVVGTNYFVNTYVFIMCSPISSTRNRQAQQRAVAAFALVATGHWPVDVSGGDGQLWQLWRFAEWAVQNGNKETLSYVIWGYS